MQTIICGIKRLTRWNVNSYFGCIFDTMPRWHTFWCSTHLFSVFLCRDKKIYAYSVPSKNRLPQHKLTATVVYFLPSEVHTAELCFSHRVFRQLIWLDRAVINKLFALGFDVGLRCIALYIFKFTIWSCDWRGVSAVNHSAQQYNEHDLRRFLRFWKSNSICE